MQRYVYVYDRLQFDGYTTQCIYCDLDTIFGTSQKVKSQIIKT